MVIALRNASELESSALLIGQWGLDFRTRDLRVISDTGSRVFKPGANRARQRLRHHQLPHNLKHCTEEFAQKPRRM
jgi:hypothetical protein